MNMENDIQVSVCVVTYNQENYIAECLESLVTQQTDFKFEIIVGEDCSKDDTRAIVQQYVDKYPDLIIPVFHEKNVGPVENIKKVYKKARGKYIAHIDGDDLALPGKLQKQFLILEKKLEIAICSHNIVRINSDSQNLNNDWVYAEGEYTALELLLDLPFFAHSSKMFRNQAELNFFNSEVDVNHLLDIDLHFENARYGNIYHINENLGGYRVNVGVSMQNNKINPLLPIGLERVYDKGLFYFKNNKIKNKKIKNAYSKKMIISAYQFALFNEDFVNFKKYTMKALSLNLFSLYGLIFLFGSLFPHTFFKLIKSKNKIKNSSKNFE